LISHLIFSISLHFPFLICPQLEISLINSWHEHSSWHILRHWWSLGHFLNKTKDCCLKLLIRYSMIKNSYLLQTFEHLTIKWSLSSIWHNSLHKCPQESLTLHFNWHPVNFSKSKPLDALPITLLWIWHFNNNFGPTYYKHKK